MATPITCICGYRGPSVVHEGRVVCPVCRTPGEAREEVLHIPCPRGHVLPVAAALVGQRLVCPKCNEFFTTAAENSVERRREADRLRHEQEARRARRWLAWALWAAALVVALFVTLVVLSVTR